MHKLEEFKTELKKRNTQKLNGYALEEGKKAAYWSAFGGITGAVLGGIVGGPVGAIAGAATGAAVSGATSGVISVAKSQTGK